MAAKKLKKITKKSSDTRNKTKTPVKSKTKPWNKKITKILRNS